MKDYQDKVAFINTICSRVDGIDKDKVSLIYDKLEKLAELQSNLVSLITYYSEDAYGISDNSRKEFEKATKEVDDYFEELLIFLATLK
jgi:archaellum component FlaC